MRRRHGGNGPRVGLGEIGSVAGPGYHDGRRPRAIAMTTTRSPGAIRLRATDADAGRIDGTPAAWTPRPSRPGPTRPPAPALGAVVARGGPGSLARGVLLAQRPAVVGARRPRQLPAAGPFAGRGARASRSNGRPTAYRPPLYPLVLAPVVAALGGRAAWGVAALHLALGAGTVAADGGGGAGLGPVAGARRWRRRRSWRCDPVLVAQSRSVMTETARRVPDRRGARGADPAGRCRGRRSAGLAFGLGVLCRPSALPAALLTAAAAPGRPAPARAGPAPCGPRSLARRDGRDARPLGGAERPGRRRAGRHHHPRRLHALPGQQPGLLRRGRQRPARRGLDGAEPEALVGLGRSDRPRGLSEPAADRALRAEAVRFIAGRPARLRAGVAGAAGPVLGPRAVGGRLPAAGPARRRRPGPPRSGSPWRRDSAGGGSGPGRGSPRPLIAPRPDRRPHRLLDRPADARDGRPGHRAGRGLGVATAPEARRGIEHDSPA